jgi:release factor-specific protein-(glutamine-N5) methyltransferase
MTEQEAAGGGTRKRLRDYARTMRNQPTEPERRLWQALRGRQLGGLKFRRQYGAEQRIFDFFCAELGLAIEVDGGTHDPENDARRDAQMLAEHGIHTLRFTNDEVMRNREGVLLRILEVAGSLDPRWPGRHPPPTPSSEEEREHSAAIAPSSSEEGVGGGGSLEPQVRQALRDATAILARTSDTARLDAEVLMAHALRCSRSDVLLRHMAAPVPDGFAALVGRRMLHEPVAYIVGTQEFYGLDLAVSPAVLIPRGDSETLIEVAREALAGRPPARILDLGTGSGALLLAALTVWREARGIGIERSDPARVVAAGNALRLGLDLRARMQPGDWTQDNWASALGRFDLILANPPYVESEAVLDRSVRGFEPAEALFAGVDGMDDYAVLIPQLPALLSPQGVAVVEIGWQQGAAVRALAEAAGLSARVHPDLAGRDRAVEIAFPGNISLGKGAADH